MTPEQYMLSTISTQLQLGSEHVHNDARVGSY